MKYLKIMVVLVICALFMCGFTVCAADYTIDFTRDEAYDAVMNTSPEQAEQKYGGEISYYAALTDSDKEALFNMIWNGTESGILFDTKHTVHLDSFSLEYFHAIISAFRQTKSDDEGLSNLRNNIDTINAEYFSEGVQSRIEIVDKTETTESSGLGETETIIQTRPPVDEYESGEITTITTIAAEKPHSHTALIVFLSFVVIAAGAAAGYLIYRKRKS